MENMRFGVKIMRSLTPLEEDKLSIYWRFEHGGETYGDYLLFLTGHGDRCEVPADVFVDGVRLLNDQMNCAARVLCEEESKDKEARADT